jgi:hypothetical protein
MQAEQTHTTPKKTKETRATSRVGFLDMETGEVLEGGRAIYVPPKMRIKGFFMADQKGFEELAKKNKLNGEAFRVLMLMMGRMDYENAISISQKEIGTALTMKKQNVWRAMKLLREAGLFDAETDHVIHLATEFGWKGKVQNRSQRNTELYKDASKRASPTDADWAAMDARIDALPKFADANATT